jgi:hypothetical protein
MGHNRGGADVRSSTFKDAVRDAAHNTRSASARAGQQAQTDQLRERLGPVVDAALQLAREQATHAAVAAGHARHWAAPRIEAAVERGLQAAAPSVEAAAERVAPAVDAARDRIVDDLLPRLIEAVHNAGTAGTAARDAAAESASRSVEDAARSLADATPPTAHARRRRARLLWLGMAVAAITAIARALRSRGSRPAWDLAPTGVASGMPASPPPTTPPATATTTPKTTTPEATTPEATTPEASTPKTTTPEIPVEHPAPRRG